MERGNQRRQLVLFHVLQLVYEQHCGSAGPLGGEARRFQQVGQILFKVAVVGEPGLRLEIEADLNVRVLDLLC